MMKKLRWTQWIVVCALAGLLLQGNAAVFAGMKMEKDDMVKSKETMMEEKPSMEKEEKMMKKEVSMEKEKKMTTTEDKMMKGEEGAMGKSME